MIVLRLDAETHGYNKEISNVEDLQEAIQKELDENVFEVLIKKRAVKDNSQRDFTKICQDTCDRK